MLECRHCKWRHSTWRSQRDAGELGRKRGRKAADPLETENAELRRRAERAEAERAELGGAESEFTASPISQTCVPVTSENPRMTESPTSTRSGLQRRSTRPWQGTAVAAAALSAAPGSARPERSASASPRWPPSGSESTTC